MASSRNRNGRRNRTSTSRGRGSARSRAANRHIGSAFEDFLKAEGLDADVAATAIKRVVVWQIAEEMRRQGLSKQGMARRMKTSRAQLDRLLDPGNDKVQLDTMQRAAAAVGRALRIELA